MAKDDSTDSPSGQSRDDSERRTSARLIVLAEDGSRAPDTLTLSEIREICRALLRALGVG